MRQSRTGSNAKNPEFVGNAPASRPPSNDSNLSSALVQTALNAAAASAAVNAVTPPHAAAASTSMSNNNAPRNTDATQASSKANEPKKAGELISVTLSCSENQESKKTSSGKALSCTMFGGKVPVPSLVNAEAEDYQQQLVSAPTAA